MGGEWLDAWFANAQQNLLNLAQSELDKVRTQLKAEQAKVKELEEENKQLALENYREKEQSKRLSAGISRRYEIEDDMDATITRYREVLGEIIMTEYSDAIDEDKKRAYIHELARNALENSGVGTSPDTLESEGEVEHEDGRIL